MSIKEDRFKNWMKPEPKHAELTPWLWVVWHPENLVIGDRVDIGAFTVLHAHEGIEIGDLVEIGPHCAILSVSTIDGKRGMVVLGKRCRIGSHTTVMPGVTIGENTIVGAHSFVNRNLPPNVIAWGVPAKIVKSLTP